MEIEFTIRHVPGVPGSSSNRPIFREAWWIKARSINLHPGEKEVYHVGIALTVETVYNVLLMVAATVGNGGWHPKIKGDA